MYLKEVEIINFRKFLKENNKVSFVDSRSIVKKNENNKVNIAPITTLIVGKNNSGKTTIITALKMIVGGNKFYSKDFNFSYLKILLDNYIKDKSYSKCPFLEFNVTIGLEEESSDLVTNIIPFMTLGGIAESSLRIKQCYEIKDSAAFLEEIRTVISGTEGLSNELRFRKFCEVIDHTEFETNYYATDGEKVKGFKSGDLIELKAIKANNIENEHCLSKAFSKIVEYRYKELLGESKVELDNQIQSINTNLTDVISSKHTEDINGALSKIESTDRLQVLLRADLNFTKLMNNLITYEFVEQANNIPENQFGLGYTNLMMIIAELIDYMEKYPDNSFNSKINLISIEEPETFMHPQMQELFIKNINDAIDTLLNSKNRNVNSQLIITTHSQHILNSKIHSGNTLNNINYVTIEKNLSKVITLDDNKICPDGVDKLKNLQFLKKHIKYKVSEIFFSDAVIFVEGVTEETILKYYIDKDSKLNKFYISVFNINGAHSLVYKKLIETIGVPTVVITDLDIKRSKGEKENFEQIESLKGRTTTNATIASYCDSYDLENIEKNITKDNILITYQGIIEGFYATSFEEALILNNFDNFILHEVLKKVKPQIYDEITDNGRKKDNIKGNSYKLQRKLASDKSEFANTLLYELVTTPCVVKKPQLPNYIRDGLHWLAESLSKEVV